MRESPLKITQTIVVTSGESEVKMALIVPILHNVQGIVVCRSSETSEEFQEHLRKNRIRSAVLYPNWQQEKVMWKFKPMPRFVLITLESVCHVLETF